MSFRKRGEVIGGNPVPNRLQAAPHPRGVQNTPGSFSSPSIGEPIGRGAPQSQNQVKQVAQPSHPGVRPSTVTSQPTTSTGSSDLDKILLHSGLPLGTLLLVEESGTTDFGSVLLRVFVSQGIIQNRIDIKVPNTHSIIIGHTASWGKELPGLYKGSTKDIKHAKILANESKISVSNLTDSNNTKGGRDLKIAWRYGLKDKKNFDSETQVSENYPHYNNQFDITSRIVPSASNQEITFIPITSNTLKPIIKQIDSIIKYQLKQNGSKVIRLVIPNLLSPSIYPPVLSAPTELIPFFHNLRSLSRQYSNNLVIISSLSLDLYPRETATISMLESLNDGVVNLQPFNQEMTIFLEKAYKNEPTKVQHGLVNIYKIPILSERGSMLIRINEFAFKNGKKKFEIEEWGIPVEDDAEEEKQTTQNIDF